MANSIKDLRSQLMISLDDLGRYLKLGRSRVHDFEIGNANERGENMEKLHLLNNLLRKSKNSSLKNQWINDEFLKREAEDWLNGRYRRAAIDVEILKLRLLDMKADYNSCLRALDTMARISDDPECPQELKTWISYTAPPIVKKALKNSPKMQARLQILLDEGTGRFLASKINNCVP